MNDLKAASDEQRFELLINAVTDYAIYMLDPNGRVTTWNSGAERIKGYRADEIIGEHFSRFFTPDDVAAGLPQRALEIAARDGRFEAEGWRLRKDGTRLWVNAILDPIFSENGKLLGYAKITRDVTDRREQERQLFESEQRFRLLVQGVHDYAIYMLDPSGRITNWNAGAEAIKGYSADEVVGKHFSQFYTPEDRERGEPANALRTALTEGKYEREAWRVRKDGTLFWASVLIDPIYDDSGKHIGFAKVTRDVTDRKRAEDELEEARAALAQSQKLQALGELTGGIAHDFNNLMTVIQGSADFLLRHLDDLALAKQQQYLQAITDTARRATTLTSHLLAFARKQPIKPVVIDLNHHLSEFSTVLRRTLGSKIAIGLETDPDVRSVEVDPAQLETAVLNAVLNARDAMTDGGSIVIGIRAVEHDGKPMVALSIRDNGSGMPPEIIDRAFEPFFTTKDVGKGTGLGLSQLHGFAAQAGGWAKIESTPGEGTTITLILPRTDQAPAQQESRAALPPIRAGLRVLLVEDDANVSAFATGLLEDIGCKVISRASGEEALKVLGRDAFDLVFTDVVMPGMSGIDLARQISARDPDLPVLLASGYSDQVLRGESSWHLVRKPYSIADVSSAIAEAMDARSRSAG